MTADARDTRTRDPFANLPLLIPVPKAAELLGISRAAAYRHANAGDLPCKRLGRRVYVITARIREFIDTKAEAA
jgi:predicted DNA-binding transcriptional regulator AlpA